MDKFKKMFYCAVDREIIFIKLVFYYFKIFGLATINFNFYPKNINKKYSLKVSTSKFHVIPNVLFLMLLILLLCIHFIKLQSLLQYLRENKNILIFTIVLLKDMSAIFVTLLTMAKYLCQRIKIVAIVKSIIEIKKLSDIFKSSIINYKFMINILLTLLFNIVYIIFTIVRSVTLKNNYFYALYKIGLLLNAITDLLVIQYIILLNIIKKYTSLINIELNKNTNVISGVYSLKKNSSKLLLLREIYLLLKKSSKKLSDFYSLPILFYIISFIFFTTTNFFYITYNIFVSKKNLNWDDLHNLISSLLSFITLRKMTVLVSSITVEVKFLFLVIFVIFLYYY